MYKRTQRRSTVDDSLSATESRMMAAGHQPMTTNSCDVTDTNPYRSIGFTIQTQRRGIWAL